MVTTVTSYTDSRNRAYPGEGYDGVVRVSCGTSYGTGVLLYDGRAVLTAAHLFAAGAASNASVTFETTAGFQTLAASRVMPLSTYDGQNNNDLALVWLSGSAPVTANRYGLYRGNDEIGQGFTMVGYGTPGSGDSGILTSYNGDPLRLKAGNQFDADAGTLKSLLGATMAWTPTAGTQLVADFDNGLAFQDALGGLIGRTDLGLGLNEGMISPGDSGGPAFVNGQIAGIASYIASLSRGNGVSDIDALSNNSSYGEQGFWQRVSSYQQWIDQSLRAQYPNAPTAPEQVQKSVAEGSGGTVYAYFLVQFTGVRDTAEQMVSVDYATRDGTAIAGSDYIAVNGTLILYPNENQAAIPVEIIGDAISEPDETFFLDVFNPAGGSLGEGVVTLTAVRTIVNDDGVWG
ncbi:MAG TPA: sodium:calcium exchanger [Gallionellaceae bacterium]|nr:sodium:calcium exchanger [Gallionellaceae bacterium]